MINEFLVKQGFKRMEADPCIYKKVYKVLEGGRVKLKHSIVAFYVDDLLVACSNKTMCKNLEAEFQKKFKMKILGEVRHILGMDVYNNMENHMVHLSQAQYIKTTLKEYQHYITKYNIGKYDSPMDNRTPHGKYQCPVPDLQEAHEMKTIPYRELIGTLL